MMEEGSMGNNKGMMDQGAMSGMGGMNGMMGMMKMMASMTDNMKSSQDQ